jgi:hypothetical protein
MAKANSRVVATKPSRVKTAVVISPEAFRRLGAACLAENLSQSEIVEALINRALSGYVVQVRGQGFRADSVKIQGSASGGTFVESDAPEEAA